jgi:hypothetical protein
LRTSIFGSTVHPPPTRRLCSRHIPLPHRCSTHGSIPRFGHAGVLVTQAKSARSNLCCR